MTQATPRPRRSPAGSRARSRRPRRSAENSDVLVSAVISTYLLTHLHHVLQRAEYGASQEGRSTQAANRSMKDASALGQHDDGIEQAA